ncbi:ATP-binding protein [Aureimonas pseudogalii]|uniref:histidine kinase n=1 Tax=Aureimonas pseudogalii TaxID=1744844 RepID=A0A7W6E9Y4_9HYPH|nr:ATP-binding protein [Aureimonas pseudogalii]MBB3997448.1 two-component system phosphate regulon sensor histidine kinase PhoR [Aureimonas pseudogalii]
MSESFPSEQAYPSRRLRTARSGVLAAILALGLGACALAAAETRAIVVATLAIAALWVATRRGAAATRRFRTQPRMRAAPLWPDASVKAVVAAMREPAFVIDRNLALRFGNEAAGRAFGLAPLGDPFPMRFRAPELLAALEAAVAADEAQSVEFSERTPIDRAWSVDILPIGASVETRAPFLLILFRDRTQASRLERMRTDFVANASHELRTPLASLTGFIETLKGPARDDASARIRFLDIMGDQAARMSRLIDDLLSLSRIETKRRLRADERVDLADVLGAVVQQFAIPAAEKGLPIETEGLAAGAMLVNGDRDELIQVFANLVENACKYGDGGSRVVVGLKREGSRVEAFVQDFGRGIAPEHVPRLTERFYRVEEGSSGVRGTGLGLSIVRNVLIRHATRLHVRSAPGAGSTFSVRFPLLRRSDQNT